MSAQSTAVKEHDVMELDKVELGILKLMSENGGELPRDFFAKKMQGLVAKGAVEAHFERSRGTTGVYSSDYTYRLTVKGKGSK